MLPFLAALSRRERGVYEARGAGGDGGVPADDAAETSLHGDPHNAAPVQSPIHAVPNLDTSGRTSNDMSLETTQVVFH
jgi:hypothetical protein